jgi:predicted dehydrogenase
VCDVDGAALERVRSLMPHVLTTTDVDKLLQLADAIVVATPSTSHASLALRCLDAGKHVLVEKPLATDMVSALSVIERAAAREKALVVGHLTLLHPALTRLRELLEVEAIGPLRRIDVTRTSAGAQHRRDSALWSLGPHDVANVLFVTGISEPIVRDAWESKEAAGLELDLRGLPVHMAWSRAATNPERKLSILGSGGALHFDEIRGALSIERGGRTEEIAAAAGLDLLARQCEAFAGAAMGRPTLAGRAFQVVRVLEQAQAKLDVRGAEQKLSASL